jgi:exosortase/archaeosortase family protein
MSNPTITTHKNYQAGSWFRRSVNRFPIATFVLGTAFYMILFYAIWLSDWYNQHIHPHLLHGYAWLSGIILNWFGYEVTVSNELITSSNQSLSIARGCDGIEAVALFTAVMLAFPNPLKFKLIHLFKGILFLIALNLMRIISLFMVVTSHPKVFDLMHTVVWQIIFIISALCLWILAIYQKPKTNAYVSQ